MEAGTLRKPAWLRRGIPDDPAHGRLRALLAESRLHTVCEAARCPNCGECYSSGTATFLILGEVCTRGCRFCTVRQGEPLPADPDEPRRVAEAAAALGIAYVVVTSVTRDDLPDGGAGLFAATIRALKQRLPGVRVEVLVPDFGGDEEALRTVLAAGPDCLNHNLETVSRLYRFVRPQARYERSLALLKRTSLSDAAPMVKSGMMLGLGENPAEVEEALTDLVAAGCSALTLGQYLQPNRGCLAVARFVPPEEFDHWREKALKMGFAHVASGPLVRSSYQAGRALTPMPASG